ncbi:hypothetical protein C8R46DRAFT_1351778 [Mycena filopes]|nr:hypothetical protein C8R46DRAFT_1351778 [Mycena filopes]
MLAMAVVPFVRVPLVLSAPINPGSCSTANTVMDLPSGQTALVAPSTAPTYVLLGVGVQNYTCAAGGSTYTSAGAVASLFDISCLQNNADYDTLPTRAFAFWSDTTSSGVTPLNVANDVGAPLLLGQHYFIPNPNGSGSLSPKWDFTAPSGDPSAFVVAAKVGDVPAPASPAANVDWLSLNAVSGSLAKQVFRVDTVGGQPPSSCAAGSAALSVKYVSRYYLY